MSLLIIWDSLSPLFKRFMEMKANQKGKDEAAGMVDKRREREKKREEKELAKMAQAAGIQLDVGSGPKSKSSTVSLLPATSIQGATSSGNINNAANGGWKKVISSKSDLEKGFSSAQTPPTPSTSGWKSVNPSVTSWKTVGKQPWGKIQQIPAANDDKRSSFFRSSGFSTLDTTQTSFVNPPAPLHSVPLIPPPPPDYDAPPPPP